MVFTLLMLLALKLEDVVKCGMYGVDETSKAAFIEFCREQLLQNFVTVIPVLVRVFFLKIHPDSLNSNLLKSRFLKVLLFPQFVLIKLPHICYVYKRY